MATKIRKFTRNKMKMTVRENWLKAKLEKMYGKRCPDYEKDCACCQAWSVYDMIIDDNRGRL